MKFISHRPFLICAILAFSIPLHAASGEPVQELTTRQFIKEEGDNIEYKKLFNKAMRLRFQKKGEEMLNFISPFLKEPAFKKWADSLPYGAKTQLANAMTNSYNELGGKEINLSNDIAFAALRDFIEPTNWNWKHELGLGGAKIIFDTKAERSQIVVIKDKRRQTALGEAVNIESYVFWDEGIPDASVLQECLRLNGDYSNSKWILETRKLTNGKVKNRLLLRASCSANLDTDSVKALIADVALKADAFEEEFIKGDKM